MKRPSLLRRVFTHPAILILPVLGALQIPGIVGMFFHTSPTTLLPNADFNIVNKMGDNQSWNVSPVSKNIRYATIKNNNAMSLRISNSQASEMAVMSPRVAIQGGKTYFYKSLYQSTMPFTLLMLSGYKNGSTNLAIIKSYVANNAGTAASHAFTADPNASSVQFVYKSQGKGMVQLTNPYLEPDPREISLPFQPNLTAQILPNAALTSTDGVAPDAWSTYGFGTNQAVFSYVNTGSAEPYLRSQMSDYKNGEAKWQYPPVTAWPGQPFYFGVQYRSSQSASVVAEYTTITGQNKFTTLATLFPTKEWTSYSTTFTAPSDVTNIFVSVVLQGNGTVDTKNYSLYDISRSGPQAWQRPLVSITFDDGWQSAFENAIPLLDKYGYKATFYLNPSSLDTNKFMNSEEVSFLKDNGYQIASHGYEHKDFTTLDASSINYQLSRAYDYFTQVHTETSVDFATPFGGGDAQVTYFARKYYASLRGTDTGINTRQNFDPYNLVALYVGRNTPLSKITEALAETKALNGWLVLIYHRLDDSTEGEVRVSPEAFAEDLSAISKSGVTVKTVRAALLELGRQ